jgi:hypothetical protein
VLAKKGTFKMSTVLKSTERPSSWSAEPSRPLDEKVWNAWLAQNRAEERRDAAARMRLLKVIALLLLAAVALFSLLASNRIGDALIAVTALTGMMIAGTNRWMSA